MQTDFDIGLDSTSDMIFKEVVEQETKKYKLEQLPKKIQELTEERKQIQSALGKISLKQQYQVWIAGPGETFFKAQILDAEEQLNEKKKLIEEQLTEMRRDECELSEELETD